MGRFFFTIIIKLIFNPVRENEYWIFIFNSGLCRAKIQLKTTRSIPRAQTSSATYLRNVKQSSHAWNSLSPNVPENSLFHAGPIRKIPWKSVQAFVRNVANRQTEKPTEMKTYPPSFVGGNYPQMRTIIVVWLATLDWIEAFSSTKGRI